MQYVHKAPFGRPAAWRLVRGPSAT